MAKIEIIPIEPHPGMFLSCHVLADANDIAEALESTDYEFVRVGYRGIWLAEPSTLEYLKTELPTIENRLELRKD